jgi:glycosyltransferase 2 family protein
MGDAATTDLETPDPAVTRGSPPDVLRLVVGVLLLLLVALIGGLFGDAVIGFVSDFLAGLDALPDWLLSGAIAAVRILALVALVAGVAATVVRTGWRMLATVLAAAVVAAVLVWLFDGVLELEEVAAPAELVDGLGPLTGKTFPTGAGIGALAATMSAAAPWLSRRWRRCGWVAVIGLAVARTLTAPLDFDSLSSVLIGWTVGSAALVVFGAPSRRPTRDSVLHGLARCGLDLADLKVASVDARGSTPYFGTGHDGKRYFVKVVGDDQRSADLLFRAYRWFHRKDLGDERPFSTLRRAAEHEAFVALAAARLGVLTPGVAGFATAEPNAFVLAYEAVDGRSLDSVPLDELTDEVLDQVWSNLAELHGARIAHRDLRLANVFLGADGRVWMIDFGFSEIAASDLLLATDVAELIASSSTIVGPDRAVAHAVAAMDAERLAAAHDRLKLSTLSGATRHAMKSRPGALEELRARLGAA